MLMMNEVRAELFLRRLPPEIRASLTAEQERALKAAVAAGDLGRHVVDLRFGLPMPWGRYYFALFGGRERRGAARRRSDRRHRPLVTTANMLFVGGLAALFCLLILIALLFLGSVVEV